MTKEEQLQKIIEKAVEGGWKMNARYPEFVIETLTQCNEDEYGWFSDPANYGDDCEHPYVYIFSHDFLKAFFGEDTDIHVEFYEGHANPSKVITEDWQYHGCQMLLSEDPIGYLSKYL